MSQLVTDHHGKDNISVKIWDKTGNIWCNVNGGYRAQTWLDPLQTDILIAQVCSRCSPQGYQKVIPNWYVPEKVINQNSYPPDQTDGFNDPMLQLLSCYFPFEPALRIFTGAFGYPNLDDTNGRDWGNYRTWKRKYPWGEDFRWIIRSLNHYIK